MTTTIGRNNFINVRDKLLESILNTDGNVMAEKIAGILNTAVTLIKKLYFYNNY